MKYLMNPRIYLLFIFTAFILNLLPFNFFVCDDAFISFRYAKNFISGHGLVWNVGEQLPVEGYTNFLWVIVISIFIKMGFDPVVVSKMLNIFFGLCCILLVYLFSEIIFKRKKFLNLIAPVILSCCGPFVAWSVEGLETQMFTFFILAGVIAHLYEMQQDRIFPISALLFVLASLTRPEGLLIFGITCLHRFSTLYYQKKSFFCRKSFIWFLTFLIIYGIYFYWRFDYYGFVFPNTFYAKTGGGIYQIWRGVRYLKSFILFNKWPILISLSLLSLFKQSRSPIIYLLMLIISFSAYIVSVGGDFFAMFRFFVPMVPPMALLVQEGIISLCQWPERITNISFPRKSAITFCSFIAILILAKGLVSSFNEDEWKVYTRHQSLALAHAVLGQWFHQHASPNETVAAMPIGAVSYYSELSTFDRSGITDIHLAHTKMPYMGRGVPGHEKHDFSYTGLSHFHATLDSEFTA